MTAVLRQIDLAQRWLRFTIAASRLNPWRMPELDPEAFRGKRVIILGPAHTVAEDLGDLRVDDYDVIVRLNNGIALAKADPARLGARTDVLFHNLNEDGPRSAGAVPPDLLRAHGVHLCVFPHWSFKGSKGRVHRKRAELKDSGIALKVPSTAFCNGVRRDLGGLQPTVGTSAMLFFLGCDLAELSIHGFTFFATPYAPGYNDAVGSGAEAQAWASASQVHDPLREKALIRRRTDEAAARGLALTLGRHVRHHLNT
ncbi:hypothetical protein [Falsirhodobacter algicola]|uniref:Glycosyl transferase family 29 (Putative sialyltransferase) n=1 Tax=Falsirhodobacter algicola TaxID=2692330 RepID=A0A8J8MTP4_9RHOB|nr:hypothetical protein [Falsirhodobacter algicola]QUS36128.1 hypothetical protein GR316_07510 [Falsirhodobacter algicola]